jgi:hypothetical protein
VDGAIRVHRKHRPTKQGGCDNYLESDGPDCLGGFGTDAWFSDGCAFIQFHHPGKIGDRFHPAEGENDTAKLYPDLRITFVQRLEVVRGQVRRAYNNERNDSEYGWHRKDDSETATVLRSIRIDHSHDQQHAHG